MSQFKSHWDQIKWTLGLNSRFAWSFMYWVDGGKFLATDQKCYQRTKIKGTFVSHVWWCIHHHQECMQIHLS